MSPINGIYCLSDAVYREEVMADSDFLSWTGAITGGIGSVTGIIGLIISIVSYRRSVQMKALDLRIELRKAEGDLHELRQELSVLFDQVAQSRNRITAATGQAGAFKQWQEEFERYRSEFTQLSAELPDAGTAYEELSYSDLESRLIAAHKIKSKFSYFLEKCCASSAADDKEREQIRSDMRSATHARLGKAP